MFGAARLSMAVENHGSGRQLLRFRSWPRCSLLAGASMACLWGLALAAAWKGPLVICALLGSLVGQTEANLRQALKIADAMSPCVLYVDELEKALSGVGSTGDSGVMP